jgi:leucyl aminopeptidase (aminopeptidase T)
VSPDQRAHDDHGDGAPDPAVGGDLRASAAAALACLGVTGADDVLVLCNAPQRMIADALAGVARGSARSVRVLEYPAGSRPSQEPPADVAEAMTAASVVFAATAFSISHTRARQAATGRGVRIASLPKITPDIFTNALLVDYDALKADGSRLAARLTAADSCHVTAPAGTDVHLSLRGRTAVCDSGDLAEPGAFGNLPAGEAYIAPIETVGDGIIVFDGSLAGYGILTEPLRVTLRDGRAVDASGKAARWLLQTLDAGGETGRQIAELGIGTNRRARITGTMLEDEKALGTAHLAFGTSASFGGLNVSDVHLDGLIKAPTITLDDRLLIRDGKAADAGV